MTAQHDDLTILLRRLRLPRRDDVTVVDLAGAHEMSHGAAVALIQAERRFRANGRRLVVVNTSREVRRQLVVLGLRSLLRGPPPERR